MGDTIEVIDWLDSDSTTGFNIFGNYWWRNKVIFKCNCGNTFERSIYKWMDGRDLCANCSQAQSSYERLFEEYLIGKEYKYKKEYRFNDCRDEKPLPFDFYITSFDCLIEIDGQQHFEPTQFDGDIKIANKKFTLQQKHDTIKNNYCGMMLNLQYLQE